MRRFQEIERQAGSQPVSSAQDGYSASGTLILAGARTEAVLQSDQLAPDGAEGWFGIRLRGANGQHILLHNAVHSSSTSHHSASGVLYEDHIYPNTVVLGAEALATGDQVKVITFTVDRMALFFHHQVMENLTTDDMPISTSQALRQLRRTRRSGEDVFNPYSIYVIHRFPRVLRFTVEQRVYEVFSFHSENFGDWRRIDCHSEPAGRITFPEPVPIDAALDAVWQWKRYFTLVTLNDAAWTALSVRAGNRRRDREADLYLPAYSTPQPSDDRRSHENWPGNIPLNRWPERHNLRDVMATWVGLEAERQRFRASIERVVGRFRQRLSVDDIVTLCSGIESLAELDTGSAITREHVRLMATAANAAAAEHAIPIGPERVSGVLGYLRSSGLPQRLRALFARLEDIVSEDRATIVIRAVQRIRTVAAHGHATDRDLFPKVGPTTRALLAACALYDLLTCGLPTRTASDYRIGLISQLDDAIVELETINAGPPDRPHA